MLLCGLKSLTSVYFFLCSTTRTEEFCSVFPVTTFTVMTDGWNRAVKVVKM
jgi:hypothetical protein